MGKGYRHRPVADRAGDPLRRSVAHVARREDARDARLRVDDLPTLATCFKRWPREKMIVLHAEKQSVAVAIGRT